MTTKIDGNASSTMSQPAVSTPSLYLKIQRIWDFVYECIIKELASCWRHLWYQVVFWIQPHKYDLNPITIASASQTQKTAKVVLLMHGMGAGPSSFIPLAKKMTEAKIKNIHTVKLSQSDEDPVPTDDLAARIQEISKKYLQKGYDLVDFAFVGHSLGALVGSKYIWRRVHHIENTRVSLMISIAGRLKYVSNKFSWFCEDVKPEIKATFEAISQNPCKAQLYTIWGNEDGIVPEESAHIQQKDDREYTVKGWGHGGVVFAPEAHEKAVSWTKQWLPLKS